MSNPEKRAVKEKTTLPLAVGTAAFLALLLVAGWYFWPSSDKGPAIEVIREPKPSAAPASAPKIPAHASAPGQAAPEDAGLQAEKAKDPCALCEEEIEAFFATLDSREYVVSQKLQGGSQAHFSKVAEKLFATPPVVAGETDSLHSILNNTAHFYRTLRKDDFFLIKKILEQERDGMESGMAAFYRWSELAPQCQETGLLIKLPLAGLYEYAGFFLNTLGGQSYLFRRESRLRTLVKYYSVLVLDRANDASLNRYGIDIRPALDALLAEVQAMTSLAGRDDYEAKLLQLQDKYLAQYGEKKNPLPPAAR